MGYTKFCDGYSEHILVNSLTNNLKHKPVTVCEVDWSGSTEEIVSKSNVEANVGRIATAIVGRLRTETLHSLEELK